MLLVWITRLYLDVVPDALSDGLEGGMQRKKEKKCEADARAWRRYNWRGSLDLWAM